jgi:hypothetical protein
MRTHVLHPGNPKKRNGQSCGCDVLSRRMFLWSHNLLSGRLIQGVERPCELIFCILVIQKSDLDEVAEVMFQISNWPLERIICLLDILKCDFGDVDESMFNVSKDFLHSGHPKRRLGHSRGSGDSSRHKALRSCILLNGRRKMQLR